MSPTQADQPEPDYHLLTVGRLNLDFFVEQSGRHLRDAEHFRASVGGSPTNIAIAARNLGIRTAVLSAVGADYAGELVLRKLAAFGVCIDLIANDVGGATSLALLSTVSPDAGERQFYRADPADTHLQVDAARRIRWGSLRAVALSADSLAAGTTPTLVDRVANEARARAIDVWWDLDLRMNSWTGPDHYAATVSRYIAPDDFVIGTEDEFRTYFSIAAEDSASIDQALRASGLRNIILKRGPLGAALYLDGVRELDAPALTSSPVCTVGGGDAAAGAVIAGRAAGLDWPRALKLSMQAAAWAVGQPYCSTGLPLATDLGIAPLTVPM